MKRVAVALVILCAIVAAGILESVYIDKVFGELDQRLCKMEESIIANDDTALSVTVDLSAWWEKKRTYLELFTYSADIRAFSVALAEAIGSIECGDLQNAQSKCVSLMSISKNLHEVLDFNLADII